MIISTDQTTKILVHSFTNIHVMSLNILFVATKQEETSMGWILLFL